MAIGELHDRAADVHPASPVESLGASVEDLAVSEPPLKTCTEREKPPTNSAQVVDVEGKLQQQEHEKTCTETREQPLPNSTPIGNAGGDFGF